MLRHYQWNLFKNPTDHLVIKLCSNYHYNSYNHIKTVISIIGSYQCPILYFAKKWSAVYVELVVTTFTTKNLKKYPVHIQLARPCQCFCFVMCKVISQTERPRPQWHPSQLFFFFKNYISKIRYICKRSSHYYLRRNKNKATMFDRKVLPTFAVYQKIFTIFF